MSRLIDWENVCLVCLKKGENRSIFERDTDSNVIVDKIIICADIFIEKGTDKPKSICLQCFDNLNVAYKFHRNYVQSDSIIKALLGTNHQEFQIKDLWKTRSSSGAQQKESPQKEILDVEESPNSDKINIKHETIENGLVDDTHDNHNSPCIDLGDSIDTPAKLVQKDLTETCFQSSAIELNDVKANKNNRAYRQLDIHMRRHKRPFSCDRCDKAFVSSWQLRRHMKVHTGEKPYACQYCGRRFTQKGHQKGHERMHTGEGTFVCPTCGKSFAYFHVLSDHRRIHTGVKKFMCEECGEGFDKRLLLERHAARHLSRDKLDTTSEHKQKKVLEKEIFQIEECAKSNEINIKHEIIESDLVDDSHDNDNSPCVDLEDNIDSEAKLALKDRAEACFQGGAVQQNDVKANKNNKVCGICNGAYRQLDIHMRRHNNERPFSCDRCDKAFVTSWQLRRHMKVHTAEKPYECQYCDRRFTQKSHRQIHERKHTGERPFICPTCGKTFSDSNVLAEHRQIHTAVKKFMCEECGEGFDARLLLERHVSRHLSRDKLDKSSEHKQKKVLEKEIFQIEECAKSNEINIKHEIIESDLADDTHDNDNSPCIDLEDDIDSEAKFTLKDRAEACFQGSAIQQDDVKANEGNKIKQHANDEISGRVRSESKASIENSCDKQSRKTVYKKALKICEICNRGFTDQYILAVHMRRHNNERPFSCDCCYKTYVTSDNLRLHMRAHTGEKPYECQYCDRRFTQKGNRNTHERTHTGERPYQCQYCDRRFIRKSHREKHERGHTGEKPFVCPTCGKSFAYSHSLSEHRWIHTGVSKFTCEKCGKGFNKRANRERHVRRCPNPEKLDKSSDHKQKKLLGKEISQIEENDNSHDINIKHEEIS